MTTARTAANRKKEMKKLATYLGVRTAHRFQRGNRMTASEAQWRVRLFVFACIIGLIGLWSIWREFL